MSTTIDCKKLSASGYDFIDEPRIGALLERRPPPGRLRDVIAKSMAKEPLGLEEAAVLLAADDPAECEQIFDAARQLKRDVYGNRIVLFAPLYVGSSCTNDCIYCAFRRSNREVVRRTLDDEDLRVQVEALLARGHKRLILVFGEHPRYDAAFMADCVRRVYAVREKKGPSEGDSPIFANTKIGTVPESPSPAAPVGIRRVNLNAAPLDHAGYAMVKAAGIGTYQIFQETYHHATYARVHPQGTRKSDYLWRLDGVARAMEAGCDDVGIGALFGLHDWRFEVLGLVAHALHLQEHYNVGPHTISFPRLRPASGVRLDDAHLVSDHDFKRLVAILRLSVPYTGLICTARETPALRREVMAFGVSQIDAGSRIELGGYTEAGDAQVMEREQFQLGDIRPLDEVMRELLADGYLPSFCTACYRLGRTGEHFMEFAIPGFIQKFCTPNALSTLTEYLMDYGSAETCAAGIHAIKAELAKLPEGQRKNDLIERLRRIRETGARDLHF
ncbi:MAG: [FeFe] hydrogenase H-cluster radical SAM maturase HydG [Thermoguttaceae bacterium]|jgi:2-iminoacetate synthase